MRHKSYSLDLRRKAFVPHPWPDSDISLNRMTSESARLCAYMWRSVGKGFWTQRGDWGLSDWESRVAKPSVHFFVAFGKSEPVGSFELIQSPGVVKIEGFGLLPAYRSKGLGRGLLTEAVERAFKIGADRVWLETATDDHPAAMPLYLSQGFVVYKEDVLIDPVS